MIDFHWNGSTIAAQPGDTIASALYRSGVRAFTHSYEYGRPRGLLCLTGACPNCMVNVDGVPNVRSCTIPVRAGLNVLSQNQNVYRGVTSLALKPFPPAPPLVEALHCYEHVYLHFDVVVVGGGPSGVESAVACAAQGLQVALLDNQPQMEEAYVGNPSPPLSSAASNPSPDLSSAASNPSPDLSSRPERSASLSSRPERSASLSSRPQRSAGLSSRPERSGAEGSAVLPQSPPLSAVSHPSSDLSSRPERSADLSSRPERSGAEGSAVLPQSPPLSAVSHPSSDLSSRPERSGVERSAVLPQSSHPNTELPNNVTTFPNTSCFGLYEGNLLGAVQINHQHPHTETLLHLRAGRVILATGAYETQLLFANNDLPGIILSTAVLRLIHRHGIVPGKRAVLIGEPARCDSLAPQLAEVGIEVLASLPLANVIRAEGEGHVAAVVTETVTYKTDLVVMCGPLVPDIGLLAQGGLRLHWNELKGAFLAESLPPSVTLVGAAAGEGVANQTCLPPPSAQSSDAIACLCMDVSGRDLAETIDAGMAHIELIKRFTKLGKSACQGRMCQMAAVHLVSQITGQSIAQVGTTVARPPAPPVTLGVLAGMRHHPVRRTPMHEQHEQLGAVWMDMGDWKRPRYYDPSASGNQETCVEQEYRAVRERAGIIDVSTLGKIEVKGDDAARLLDLVYTHQFSRLPIGRVRYAVLCDELGTIVDDGTISRIDQQRYFLTTTTGNVDFVQQWLDWWATALGYQVNIINLTAGLASMNLAGPLARAVLSQLTECDLSSAAFPYMDWRHATVAGVPATMMRIGFVGEMGWEIVVPAEHGSHVWQQAIAAGAAPFGVEAQRVLRLEKKHIIVGVDTDALCNPYEAGMAWVAKLDKPDFIGRVALSRLQQYPPQRALVGFELQAAPSPIIVPPDGSPVLVEGKPVGWATSVRFSWDRNKVIGMAWVTPAQAEPGTPITLRSEGMDYLANVVDDVFYDPTGVRLKM